MATASAAVCSATASYMCYASNIILLCLLNVPMALILYHVVLCEGKQNTCQ